MNMLSMALLAASTALLAPAIDFVSNETPASINSQPVVRSADWIVGDGDFNQVRTEYPSDPANQVRNHTLRLQYIESMLRSRDVSDMPAELRAERMRNLDRLRDYWTRAEYPVNYDHPTAWEPCFIDKKGAICAVGYLVEQSAGRELAEKINSRYQYATIKEIDAPELADWITHSGLSKAEVVTIQGPSMEWEGGKNEQARIVQRRNLPARATPRERQAQEKTVTIDRSAVVENVLLNNVAPVAVEEPAPVMIAEPTPVESLTIESVPVATEPSNVGTPGIE